MVERTVYHLLAALSSKMQMNIKFNNGTEKDISV
jgi:hypothetical protein